MRYERVCSAITCEPSCVIRRSRLVNLMERKSCLDYLLHEPMRSIVIGKDRLIPVALPQPGRYCVHKLAVSALRSPGNAKSGKDILQATVLAAVLSTTQEFALEEAIDGASRTLRQKARRGVTQAVRVLGDNYPEAVRLMERLID